MSKNWACPLPLKIDHFHKPVKSGPFLGEGVLVKFLLTAYFIKYTGKVICVDSLESNTTVTIIRQGAVNLS